MLLRAAAATTTATTAAAATAHEDVSPLPSPDSAKRMHSIVIAIMASQFGTFTHETSLILLVNALSKN